MINYNLWKKKRKKFNRRWAGILAQGRGLIVLVAHSLL
jgi:hypothetical protein